jgi:hypothetical protein
MKELQSGLLKNAKPTSELANLADTAAEGYAKQLLKSNEKSALQFKNASPTDRKVLLKNAGYSDDGINRIIKKYDEVAGATAKQTAAPVNQTVQQGTKTAKQTVLKYKGKLLNSLKTKGWKKTLAVAAGLGITGAVLWQLAKDNGVQSTDLPEQPPADSNLGGQPITASGTKYEIPTELGGTQGVQDFQTWLDTNKPGWHSKYQTLGGNVQKGFGKFGPNTSRAWQDEEIKKTYLASKGQQEEPIPTKRELEQPVTLDRPNRDTTISNQIPQKLSTQAPTLQAPQTNLTPQQQRKVDRMRNRQQQ